MARTIIDFEDGTVGSTYVVDATADVTSAPKVDNAHVWHGTKAMKVTGSGSYQYIEVGVPSSTDIAVGYYLYTDVANTTGSPDDLQLFNGAASVASTDRVTVQRQSANKLTLVDAAGATKWTATSALTAATFYRVELRYTQATGTLAGGYYVGDSTTAVETFSVAGCTVPPQIDNIRLGKRVTAAQTPNRWYDDLQIQTNPSGSGNWPLGPTPSSAAPTANAGPDQQSAEPYTTVTLDGSGSTAPAGSSLTGYAWTQTAGTSVTLSDATAVSPTFTAPASVAGGTLTFSLVVTSTGAVASAANTVDIAVLPHTVFRLETGTPSPLLMVRL